ncbi:hypothetical protein DVH24_009951 [Malus domestica]|uniref:Uncharacterized protein n=1 Tax=Malus domestica TaxID=3750 RepID=A0A498JRF8_MALDO|nr:hypothetical protein DVH24_009951 [Malus domestica]
MELKLNKDWGSTHAAIDNCLAVGDQYDAQVQANLRVSSSNINYDLNKVVSRNWEEETRWISSGFAEETEMSLELDP